MSLRTMLLALAGLAAASAAPAQVTAVVTESIAVIESNFFNQSYSGDQIEGAIEAFEGDGGSFESTSLVLPDYVEFENGNSAAGFYARLFSRTIVDITFTNDGDTAVTPVLHSTITPAGLGMFIAPNGCLPDTRGCQIGLPGDASFQSFDLSSDATSNALVGGSFLFRITSGDDVMYDLEGSVALVRDEATGLNTPIADIDEAAAALSGFRFNAPEDSQTEFGFAWDATDILVPFPDGLVLQPGESSTLRYETITQTFSNTTSAGIEASLLAYSSFGDPVGRRGGSTRTPLFGSAPLADGVLTYDSFLFRYPTFENGVLTYTLDGFSPQVPEPASWAMMIVGFGLVGGAMRRGGRATMALAARG